MIVDELSSVDTSPLEYEKAVEEIVKKMPDLSTKVGSFSFMRTSNTDDPETAIEKHLAPFESAVRDYILALKKKSEEVATYVASYISLRDSISAANQPPGEVPEGVTLTAEESAARDQQAAKAAAAASALASAEEIVLEALNELYNLYKSPLGKLLAILSAIEAFESTTFAAFAVINSKRYLAVAAALPEGYPVDFIQVSKRFISSGKELPAFTEMIYSESQPEALINSFVSESVSQINSILNFELPDLNELFAEVNEAISSVGG